MAESGPEVRAGVEVVDPRQEPGWDYQVSSHPGATVFHSSGWARVLVESYGFHPCYFVRRVEGGIAGAWPVMEVCTPLRPRRGVSLPFTDSCKPMSAEDPAPSPAPPVSASLEEAARRDPLLGEALRMGRSRGWRSIEFREAEAWTGSVAPSVMFYGHTINLCGGEEAVWDRCASAVRRAVRKADAGALRCVIATDELAMKTYYGLHCLTRRRHGAPPQPYRFFDRIRHHLIQQGQGFVVLAMKEDLAVAGAVFLRWGRKALYKFGASNEEFQALRPNNLVFREAIRSCIDRGCESLDLGRTSLDNAGLRRFKLGWGASERMIPYYRFDLGSGRVEPTPDMTSGWQAQIFRRLPLPLSRLIGRLTYRFAA